MENLPALCHEDNGGVILVPRDDDKVDMGEDVSDDPSEWSSSSEDSCRKKKQKQVKHSLDTQSMGGVGGERVGKREKNLKTSQQKER